jgi:hypothetical protein
MCINVFFNIKRRNIMQTTSQRVQKLVTFSSKLYGNAVARANRLGIPFAEYVRHVVIKDIEEGIENLPMVNEETDKRIGESLKAYKEGRYTEVDPTNEEQMNELVGLK